MNTASDIEQQISENSTTNFFGPKAAENHENSKSISLCMSKKWNIPDKCKMFEKFCNFQTQNLHTMAKLNDENCFPVSKSESEKQNEEYGEERENGGPTLHQKVFNSNKVFSNCRKLIDETSSSFEAIIREKEILDQESCDSNENSRDTTVHCNRILEGSKLDESQLALSLRNQVTKENSKKISENPFCDIMSSHSKIPKNSDGNSYLGNRFFCHL